MKVVQVVPHIGAESSGPSYSVPMLCHGLVENGVKTQLCFLREIPQWLKGEKFKIANYPQRDNFNLGWSPEMARGLREACQTADVIHGNSLWMMPNVYPFWAVKGTKCKLVVAPRGTLAAWSLKKGWLKKKIFGWLLQNQVLSRADMFHATSEKEYEEIRAAGYKQPVAIVPIGMEVPETRLRSKVEVVGGEGRLHRVAFFGRLHKVKAVDRLVQAWEIITKESNHNCQPQPAISTSFHDWELVVAGPDNGIRDELEQYIAEHKVPRVRFVGEINGVAKYDFLSASDIYVLPSFTENFGITVAEALACGTPAIVSRGTPWHGVGNNRCGWWVENTPGVLAETMRQAMSISDEERSAMGKNGKEWIRRDFSWEGIGAKMKAAYEWLLNGGDRPEYVKID